MNVLARAFQRSRGTQPSVSASAVDGQTISTSLGTDRIDIRATAINRGGYAEAIGLDDSTVSTLAGDDNVRIHAQARGLSTNAWAMRNSSLDTGSGNDSVHLRASTRAGAFDPAYGALNSSIVLGDGQDSLHIGAKARGNTTDTIASYGALESQINTGADDDRVQIRSTAANRLGLAEAIGLEASSLETEGGDDDINLHAGAYGNNTQAQALHLSLIHISEPTRPY